MNYFIQLDMYLTYQKQATYTINNYRIYLVGDMGEAVLAGIKDID